LQTQRGLEESDHEQLIEFLGKLQVKDELMSPVGGYGDGVQTPLFSMEGEAMRLRWSFGVDRSILSQFGLYILNGDICNVLNVLQQAANLSKLLDRREGFVRMTPLMLSVLGCRSNSETENHLKIAETD
jgi:hypothetical protein